MAKRLVRAKYKIKAAHIPYRVPDDIELSNRLRPVLSVLYLIYNAGADDVGRGDPRTEAIRLTRVLVALMPHEPEAVGLLALMLLSDARMPARGDGADVVLLKDQDRSLWDSSLIVEGQGLVLACMRRSRFGPFQLQAAIQALHCAARRYEATDWAAIVRFYDRLLAVMPTPVVDAKQGRRRRRDQGAGDRDGAARRGRGRTGRLPPAARLSRVDVGKAGRTHEAGLEYDRAAALAPTETDMSFLSRRRAHRRSPSRACLAYPGIGLKRIDHPSGQPRRGRECVTFHSGPEMARFLAA